MERSAILKSLKQTGPEVVAFYEAEEALLKKRYAQGKWTVRQILVHLADAEFMYLGRVFAGIAEPGATVQGFDQDVWAAELHYDSRPLPLCRALFDGARESLIDLLGRVDDEVLDNAVHHTEQGRLTVREMLRYHTWHSAHHLEQIAAAREGRTWEPESQ